MQICGIRQAKKKAGTKRTSTGEKALSIASLVGEFSGLCRLFIVPIIDADKTPKVNMIEMVSPTQQRAFDLLNIKLF